VLAAVCAVVLRRLGRLSHCDTVTGVVTYVSERVDKFKVC
jgi:hypothetical protein